MRNIPLNVLLSFPTPNYTNPETRGSALVIVNAVFAGFCTIFLLLRLYTRKFIQRSLGWDDASLTIGYVFAMGLAADVILANTSYYWDRHIYDIPLSASAPLGKTAMAAKELFTVAATFVRMALLLFYYRLVNDTGLRYFKRILHASMVFNVLILIAFTFLTVLLCIPVSAYWTYGEGDQCLDEGKTTLAAGIINCFADLLTTLLPIPMILQLNMPLAQRVGVAFLMSLGLIVTMAGIVRTYFIWKALLNSYDETWFAYPLWISAAVEIQLAVITASIPALRPLFALYVPSLGTSLGKITDKLSSIRSRSTPNTSEAHSANRTTQLSKMQQSVDSEYSSAYPLSDIEKANLEIRPATAIPLGPLPRRPNWEIMHSQSVEIKHDALTSPSPPLQLPTWSPVSSFLSPRDGQNRHTRDRSSLTNIFTRWLSSTSDGGSDESQSALGGVAVEQAANLQQHPLRNDSGGGAPNFSMPNPRNTAYIYSQEPNLIWPIHEPTLSNRPQYPRRTQSQDECHRVEIRNNPFLAQRENQGRWQPSQESGKEQAESRATTVTSHPT